MRHRTLLTSALRANAAQLSKHHAPPCAVLTSLSRDLSRTRTAQRRSYTSASPTHRRQHPSTATAAPTTTTILPPATTTNALPPSAANPPPTTRPPPLNLPVRAPNSPRPPFLSPANFSHLLATGVAYLKFYKTGLKHIITNTRLLYSKRPDILAARPHPSTRAYLHLRLRWQHDVRRLPLFALILLVCGEFTPLVVLALPGAVPLA
ncbi:hypothetical protein C8A01DRAFT_41287, partial [Parachaetomium inaequale]